MGRSDMSKEALSSPPLSCTEDGNNDEKIYGSYARICIVALTHSEDIADHELALDVIEWGKQRS